MSDISIIGYRKDEYGNKYFLNRDGTKSYTWGAGLSSNIPPIILDENYYYNIENWRDIIDGFTIQRN